MDMRRLVVTSLCMLCIFFIATAASAGKYTGKKILYIDSYHEGYAWSDGIVAGIKDVLKGTDIELKIFRMDTKRNATNEYKEATALKAKALIEELKPNVVIASDDNASLYIVSRFYKDAAIPFVFCGVNWDVSNYKYPYKNATGMVEVNGVTQLLEKMKPFAKGGRIGYLSANEFTDQKEADVYKKIFKINMTNYFTKDFADWKDKFTKLQTEVDMVVIGNNAGIKGWNEEDAKAFVLANTKVPTGALYDWCTPYALLGAVNVPEEQGQWSAQTALKILDGTPPSSIKIASNKKINLILNKKVAKTLNVTFPPDYVKSAFRVIE
jgi:ABC-type uncharacterized transport system substrate-binding protein